MQINFLNAAFVHTVFFKIFILDSYSLSSFTKKHSNVKIVTKADNV